MRTCPADEGWVEHTVLAGEEGRSVGDILAGPLGLTRDELRRLTRDRAIRRNGRPTSPGHRVRAGDVVSVLPGAGFDARVAPAPVPLSVLHEDSELLVLDKPPGLLAHPVVPGARDALVNGIAHHFQRQGLRARVHLVHRLDRDTSGVLVIAKTPDAHRRLDAQLRARTLRREYLAVASGEVPGAAGVVDAPIGRDPARPALRVVRPDGQPACTRYRVVERLSGATLLRLDLETGRTHQIRVHLAHLGHAVVGDAVYGASTEWIGRQALHAVRLSLVHPAAGQELSFEAPLPADMQRLLERLRGS